MTGRIRPLMIAQGIRREQRFVCAAASPFLLVLVLAVAGCGGAADGGAGAAESSAGADLNVLLITIDTLRADRLGVYGYDAVETPNIDGLARQGVRFERVVTTVPVTLPAHASIMTGLQPFQHGVRNNGAFVLRDDAATLAEQFAAAGYATGGFISAVVLNAEYGIGQGFEHYAGLAAYQVATGDTSGERPGGSVVDDAAAWIGDQAGPFFAWVHMYDPHDPYAAPEPYGGRYAASPYDGEVAYVDAMVGRLRDFLEESGVADNTLIVLTADHGESLGDHGEQGHSYFIYDSTVRVPLIFWAPERVPAGVVATQTARVVDIFPTLLGIVGIPAPVNAGVDLAPRFENPGLAGRVAYAESLIPYLDFGWSELRAIVDGNYKYIAAPEPELYDLSVDPGEQNNLVDVDIERADAMEGILLQVITGDDVTEVKGGAVDAENVAALQALGYLAGGGALRDRRDIDPKDMVETYETFVRGLIDSVAAIEEERFGDANEILVQLDDLIPDQYIVYYYFGQLAYRAGDPQTSVEVLERALELNPSYLPTYTQLANALYASGDPTGAQDLITEALAVFPANFSLTLLRGALHHDQGALDAALGAYRIAARLDPDHPVLLERLGHLHLLRGEPRESADALRTLTLVTPEVAAVWAQLAVALAQAGDAEQAQRALTRALQIDPNDPVVRQVAAQLR